VDGCHLRRLTRKEGRVKRLGRDEGGREKRKDIREERANARQVKDPSGKTIYSSFKEPQGTFSMTVEKPGKFLYCFSNEMSSYARKVLS